MTSDEIAIAIVIIMIGALAFLCYFISFIIRCNNIGRQPKKHNK